MPERIAEHPSRLDQWLYVTPDFIVGQFRLPAIAPVRRRPVCRISED